MKNKKDPSGQICNDQKKKIKIKKRKVFNEQQ